ncbi:acetyltransferase, GNAT family [Necator americanus]|uniref:Acetyltransferase, GNAT family n=1 Tax=Necator americanus TaxID=51031 RepID=W2TFP8_NECAM|nr:acetyltransferase, GNAT family [Necator americanus]ETN80021.1 acetyltransferase, GNAT family [Necator americanus]
MRLNQNVKIIGSNVVLVPYEKDHVIKYHKWMEDDEIRRLTGSERLSLDEEYEMQRAWRNDEDKLTFIILSKVLVDSGVTEIDSMIGDVNLFLQQQEHTVEVEIMVAEKEARGGGLGTEAVSLLISYALKELGVKQYFAKITDDNIASLHLFEDKLKFRRVAHSDVFKEYTLELPSIELESFRELINRIELDLYRN